MCFMKLLVRIFGLKAVVESGEKRVKLTVAFTAAVEARGTLFSAIAFITDVFMLVWYGLSLN